MTAIHPRTWWPSNFVQETLDGGQREREALRPWLTHRDVFDTLWHVQMQNSCPTDQAQLFGEILSLVLQDVPTDKDKRWRLFERARRLWHSPATAKKKKASGYYQLRRGIVKGTGGFNNIDEKESDVLAEALSLPLCASMPTQITRRCDPTLEPTPGSRLLSDTRAAGGRARVPRKRSSHVNQKHTTPMQRSLPSSCKPVSTR